MSNDSILQVESHIPQQKGVSSPSVSDKSLNCPSCDYSTNNKHYLRQHVALVHTTDRPFKCPFCDYAGKRSHALKEHLVVHSDERPYHCTQCNATFRKKGHLTNHYRMHSEAKLQAECKFCAVEPFDTHEQLYQHLRTVHKPLLNTQVFCCSRCSYATTNRANLRTHEIAHDDYRQVVKIKPKLPPSASVILKCSACGFEASYKKEFEEHVLEKHRNELNITHSHKSFGLYSLESKHVVSQGSYYTSRRNKDSDSPKADTVNKCHQCGFITDTYKQLISHIVSHKTSTENERPVQSLSTSNHVTVAQGSFTEQNGSYTCNICGYDCESQRTIKAHMWRHSGHKSLVYPTFQNGPLSIYDGTLLAANNFINKDRESVRAMFDEQQLKTPSAKQNNSGNSSNVSVKINKTDLLSNNRTNEKPLGPFPKVIVQKIHQLDGFRTDSSQRVDTDVKAASSELCTTHSLHDANHNVTKITLAPTVHGQTDREHPVAHQTSQQIAKSGPDHDQVIYDSTSNSHMFVQEADVPRVSDELDVEISTVQGNDSVVGSNTSSINVDNRSASCNSSVVCVSANGDVSQRVVSSTELCQEPELHTENPLQLITAACEVVDRQHVGSVAASTKIDKNGRWSDTEQSAATLLSLLRQGPNFNPACPPKEGNQPIPVKDMNMDIGAEEVVGSDRTDSGSVDSIQSTEQSSSDTASRPKSGICSSLLAVIEQLREEKCENSDDAVDQIPKKKKRLSKPLSDVLASEKYPNAEQLATVTEEGVVYRCKLCHYSSSAILMKQHMKMHKVKKPFECSLCDFVASCTSSLQDHMIQHCKIRQYQCKKCSAVFSYKSQLRAHSRVHDECQAFYCEYCDFVTSYIDSYHQHVGVHVNDGMTLKCAACQQSFDQHDDLLTHTKLCLEAKRFQSLPPSIEGQSIDCVDANDDSERNVKCDQCDFVALSLRSLKSHRKRHVNDKRYIQHPLEQYKCNMCGYVCHHMPSLKSHMWKHAGETDFSYNFSDILSGNPPLDKEGKPFITLRCCQCGFETIEKDKLNAHMQSHWDIIKKTFDVGGHNSSQ